MGNRRAGAGRLAGPYLGDRYVRARTRLRGSVGSGARCRDLAGQCRKVVLHRLELGDGTPELHAIERVLDRLLKDLFERAGYLLQADRGPKADEQILIDGRSTHGLRDGAVE